MDFEFSEAMHSLSFPDMITHEFPHKLVNDFFLFGDTVSGGFNF
jgi:hypothetical protein